MRPSQRPQAAEVTPILSPEAILSLRAEAAQIHVAPELYHYVVALAPGLNCWTKQTNHI